ncbi:MAG: hypothetical protein LBE76_04920 [Nitrososphaerota archaeon]|nr:hypothetical protein [Nitrososphaerota archaeon]
MSLLIYGKTLNLTYVPSAVTGFTTISGIIIAFIGLLISHIYTQERTDRKIWTKYRFLMVIATVFMSMVFVIGGLVKLAEGNLILAYKLASIGILSTSLNVVFLPQNLKA